MTFFLVCLGLTTPLRLFCFGFIYSIGSSSASRSLIWICLFLVWFGYSYCRCCYHVNTNQSCRWRRFYLLVLSKESVFVSERERERRVRKIHETIGKNSPVKISVKYQQIKYKDQGSIETGRLSGSGARLVRQRHSHDIKAYKGILRKFLFLSF